MIIELTKKFVIDALMAEKNLRSGFSWISQGAGSSKDDCPVCAIGAVMRAAMNKKSSESSIYDACEVVTRTEINIVGIDNAVSVMAWNGSDETEAQIFRRAAKTVRTQPWRTLSFVFETLARVGSKTSENRSSWDDAVIKSKVLRFVRRHFPKTALANINGYLPATDVRVIPEMP